MTMINKPTGAHDVEVKLNINEIGILLSALELLTYRDENLLSRTYGPPRPLHSRLLDVYDQLDSSILNDDYSSDASY